MNRRLIATGALALALLALSGSTASAQYRGRDWNDDKRGSQHQDDWNRSHHPKFDDRDRQVTRDWYFRNRNHLGRGWSHRDRLSPSMERRLRLLEQQQTGSAAQHESEARKARTYEP